MSMIMEGDMKNPFLPNGVTPSKIIYRLAQDDFGDIIREHDNFLAIKRDIIKALKKMKPDELEENRLNTLVWIEHMKQNDFGNFVSVRFGYWGLILACAVMIIGDVPIYEYFNMSKKTFGNIVMIFLIILLVTMARTIHMQHDDLEYLTFKLMCINEIIEERKSNFQSKKHK